MRNMWVHDLNPTLLDIGPLEIRWYGLVYVLGFFLTIWWMHYLRKKGKIELSSDQIWDFLFYVMIGILVGARLFLIFWYPKTYLTHPGELIKIWEGGMSFHGGFIGAVVAGWFYCKKKNISFWQMADVICVPAMFALALGRLANFINGELVGRLWNGRWCVVFPAYDDMCRHPNMIYSFVQRMVLFGWLAWLSVYRDFKRGFIFWNFVLFEGMGRFIVDFFREDVLYLGLSVGQWFSVLMIIIAMAILLFSYRKEWRKIL